VTVSITAGETCLPQQVPGGAPGGVAHQFGVGLGDVGGGHVGPVARKGRDELEQRVAQRFRAEFHAARVGGGDLGQHALQRPELGREILGHHLVAGAPDHVLDGAHPPRHEAVGRGDPVEPRAFGQQARQ